MEQLLQRRIEVRVVVFVAAIALAWFCGAKASSTEVTPLGEAGSLAIVAIDGKVYGCLAREWESKCYEMEFVKGPKPVPQVSRKDEKSEDEWVDVDWSVPD